MLHPGCALKALTENKIMCGLLSSVFYCTGVAAEGPKSHWQSAELRPC